MLYSISLSYTCFGIEEENGVVVDAPPIAYWMIGERLSRVEVWVRSKNGVIMKVPRENKDA